MGCHDIHTPAGGDSVCRNLGGQFKRNVLFNTRRLTVPISSARLARTAPSSIKLIRGDRVRSWAERLRHCEDKCGAARQVSLRAKLPAHAAGEDFALAQTQAQPTFPGCEKWLGHLGQDVGGDARPGVGYTRRTPMSCTASM